MLFNGYVTQCTLANLPQTSLNDRNDYLKNIFNNIIIQTVHSANYTQHTQINGAFGLLSLLSRARV